MFLHGKNVLQFEVIDSALRYKICWYCSADSIFDSVFKHFDHCGALEKKGRWKKWAPEKICH
jgi:hypothetical protein